MQFIKTRFNYFFNFYQRTDPRGYAMIGIVTACTGYLAHLPDLRGNRDYHAILLSTNHSLEQHDRQNRSLVTKAQQTLDNYHHPKKITDKRG